jgi:hypothetical protein
MPTPTTIEGLIATVMLDVLTQYCITDVDDDDASKVNEIIIGKPTEELRKKNVLSIHTVHPLGPESDTETIMMGTPTRPNERPYKWPTETLGGMKTYNMIGAIQVNLRQNVRAPDAIPLIAAIETRVKIGINRDPRLDVLKDDFGYVAHLIETFQGRGYASGGGKTSLHRRWIDWRATIHSPNWREGEL